MIVGIVGGGQLARMLALAGYPLGLRFLVLDPAADACAGQVAELLPGAYDDPAALALLAERAELITFDFENVPVESARFLQQRLPVFPPPTALELAQERYSEKMLFQELGIPTPPFALVDSLADLHAALSRIGLPAVLKTRRLGYDGKGQHLLHGVEDATNAWASLGRVPLILEGFVAFQHEVSLLAVRSRAGEVSYYPLVENHHQEGILHRSHVPCGVSELESEARGYANRILEHLDYVGVLAVEFFVMGGRLLANEMAPRVHNSGHWTLEGAETSQFENHLRAILGLPLGATSAVGHSTMVNFIGRLPQRSACLHIPGVHFHDYGKAAKAKRKVGHATVRADDPALLQARLERLLALSG